MKRGANGKDVRREPESPIDRTTIDLLDSWKRTDATGDPELLRAMDEEIEEFKRAMRTGRLPGSGRSFREPVYFPRLGPLGPITHPQCNAEVVAITDWLSGCLKRRHEIIVPAIACYEMRRELLRANKTFSVARLEVFVKATPDRCLALSDPALRLAAERWAKSRQAGHLAARPESHRGRRADRRSAALAGHAGRWRRDPAAHQACRRGGGRSTAWLRLTEQ